MECYAIIDTNVIVSAMLKPGSTPRAIFDEAINGRITPLYNDKILDGYI